MAYRRVLTCIDDQNCVQLPYAMDDNGNTQFFEITDNTPMPISYAQQQGGVVLKEKSMIQIGANGNPAIGIAETATGELSSYRMETAGKIITTKKWTVTLSNENTGLQKVLVGDAIGLVAEGLGLLPPVNVTVSGTWGGKTLDYLKSIPASVTVDLHALWIQNTNISNGADSQLFYSSGQLRLCYADIAGDSTTNDEINLQSLLRPDNFQQSIRVIDDFRFNFNPLAAILVQIPAGQRVSLTMGVRAAGLVDGMKLISQG